ncbi:hypothetical protein SK128_013212 [Halocaridina rubra]|uniref:Uncharacterized protein n=1 Tax=Halocaridina rubra TaxID=373956 RepID=A0AAN8X1X0_HALRR
MIQTQQQRNNQKRLLPRKCLQQRFPQPKSPQHQQRRHPQPRKFPQPLRQLLRLTPQPYLQQLYHQLNYQQQHQLPSLPHPVDGTLMLLASLGVWS